MPDPVIAILDAAAGDDVAMATLRVNALTLADGSDLSRQDDHAVITQLVAARAQGRLAAHAPPATTLYRLAPVSAPQAAPPIAPAASPRAAPAAAPALAAIETTFSAALDVAAMVAVLQQAAQDGVPFCEECARAAARAAA